MWVNVDLVSVPPCKIEEAGLIVKLLKIWGWKFENDVITTFS